MLDGMLRMMLSPLRVTDTRALEALAQFGFLIIHIKADTTAGECTKASANEGGFSGFDICGGTQKCARRAAQNSASACSKRGIRKLLFASVRIGGAGAKQEGCRSECNDRVFHGFPQK
jgi:hypothetical protein